MEEIVVAHQEDVYLTDIDLFDQHLVVSERFNGLPRRCVIELKTMARHHIQMPEVYDISSAWNPNATSTAYRFTYTSPTPKCPLRYETEYEVSDSLFSGVQLRSPRNS